MNFNFECVYNSLSFGHVSTCLTLELFRRGISPNIFHIGNNVDLSSYDKLDQEFANYLSNCINKSVKYFKKDIPYLKLWHIAGSWHKISNPSSIITFYELGSPTEHEINILNSYDNVFVTSNYCKQIFQDYGINNVHYLELGFDKDHYRKLDKQYLSPEITTWGIFGKAEPLRKRTGKVIKNWVKKYGNNRNHVLHAAIVNPFLKPEDQNRMINEILEGKQYFNINFLPYVKTSSELNDIFNSIDIVFALSGGEGRDLPVFHSVGMGKHCLGLRAHAYLDYLNDDNAVLIEPSSQIKAVDGIFFHEGSNFNNGNLYDWKDEDFMDACDIVLKRKEANKLNTKGLELQQRTYKATVDSILKKIKV